MVRIDERAWVAAVTYEEIEWHMENKRRVLIEGAWEGGNRDSQDQRL